MENSNFTPIELTNEQKNNITQAVHQIIDDSMLNEQYADKFVESVLYSIEQGSFSPGQIEQDLLRCFRLQPGSLDEETLSQITTYLEQVVNQEMQRQRGYSQGMNPKQSSLHPSKIHTKRWKPVAPRVKTYNRTNADGSVVFDVEYMNELIGDAENLGLGDSNEIVSLRSWYNHFHNHPGTDNSVMGSNIVDYVERGVIGKAERLIAQAEGDPIDHSTGDFSKAYDVRRNPDDEIAEGEIFDIEYIRELLEDARRVGLSTDDYGVARRLMLSVELLEENIESMGRPGTYSDQVAGLIRNEIEELEHLIAKIEGDPIDNTVERYSKTYNVRNTLNRDWGYRDDLLEECLSLSLVSLDSDGQVILPEGMDTVPTYEEQIKWLESLLDDEDDTEGIKALDQFGRNVNENAPYFDWEHLEQLAADLMEAGNTELSEEVWDAVNSPSDYGIPQEEELERFTELQMRAEEFLAGVGDAVEEEGEEGEPEWDAKDLPYHQKGEGDFATTLANKLNSAKNPEWYLSALAMAFSKTEDENQALQIADRLVKDQPQPPEDETAEALKVVADDQAMDDYLGIGASPLPQQEEATPEGEEASQEVEGGIANEDVYPEENSKGLVVPFTPFIDLTKTSPKTIKNLRVKPSPFFKTYTREEGVCFGCGARLHEYDVVCEKGNENLCETCLLGVGDRFVMERVEAENDAGRRSSGINWKSKSLDSMVEDMRNLLQRDSSELSSLAENEEWDHMKAIYDQIFGEIGVGHFLTAEETISTIQDLVQRGNSIPEVLDAEHQQIVDTTQLIQQQQQQETQQQINPPHGERTSPPSRHPSQETFETEEIDEDGERTEAQVSFGGSEKNHKLVRQAIKDLGLNIPGVVTLTGAEDPDSEVTIDYYPPADSNESHVTIFVNNPLFTMEREIFKNEKGELELYNNTFYLKPHVPMGSGVGFPIFSSQVFAAQERNFRRIRCSAARRETPDWDWNNPANNKGKQRPDIGYWVWPRFGYNCRISDIKPETLQKDLRKEFPNAKDILDVMATQEGRDWWWKNGSTNRMYFDLREDSKCMKAFNEYLQYFYKKVKKKS